MFAGIAAILAAVPGWIQAGVATYGIYQQIKALIDEDRTLTADERATLEAQIAADEARVNDPSRDIPTG